MRNLFYFILLLLKILIYVTFFKPTKAKKTLKNIYAKNMSSYKYTFKAIFSTFYQYKEAFLLKVFILKCLISAKKKQCIYVSRDILLYNILYC